MHDRFLGGFVRYNYSTRACNTMDCCSSTHKTVTQTGCTAVCGGSKHRICRTYSNYDGRKCSEEICGASPCGRSGDDGSCGPYDGCQTEYLSMGCYDRIVGHGSTGTRKYHKCRHITNHSIVWGARC